MVAGSKAFGIGSMRGGGLELGVKHSIPLTLSGWLSGAARLLCCWFSSGKAIRFFNQQVVSVHETKELGGGGGGAESGRRETIM